MRHLPERDSLPGNPHGYDANFDAPAGHYQVAQAVLALAFEQRTANIIAAQQLNCGLVQANASISDDTASIINTRLGLEADDD